MKLAFLQEKVSQVNVQCRLIGLMLACILACGLVIAAPSSARADDVSDAQAALDEAEAQMKSITDEYNQIKSDIDELQTQIDETAEKVLEAQDAVLEGREALGRTAVYQYRNDTISSLTMLVLQSQDFDGFLRSLSYLESILDFQNEEVIAQQQRVEEFESAASELDAQKDEQESKLEELDKKKEEAQNVVDAAEVQLENAKEAEAQRLAALQAEAQRLAAEQAADEAVSGGGDGSGDESSSGGSSSSGSSSSSSSGSSTSSSSDSSSSSSSGWSTGLASAYEAGESTSTGEKVTDSSMGVAIPMSWSNYSSYFGRTVEISWNGKTVYATVNDCGSLEGGARSLDLQPGVWREFGFSSAGGWGVRTVQYRFL